MSSIKKNYRTIYGRRPVNRDTARACSGEDKDYESKPKIIETVQYLGTCNICHVKVNFEDLDKHLSKVHLKTDKELGWLGQECKKIVKAKNLNKRKKASSKNKARPLAQLKAEEARKEAAINDERRALTQSKVGVAQNTPTNLNLPSFLFDCKGRKIDIFKSKGLPTQKLARRLRRA